MIGNIHSYESFSTLDGPGVRFVIFLQGCPLRCLYCHNPDTWSPDAGTPADADTVVAKVEACHNYLRNGGVTLSGGEPLLQPDFCHELLTRFRALRLHTAIDTSGAIPLEKSAPVIDAADLILLDLKALDDTLHRELTGCGNANTLATLDYCEKTNRDVWIRHVIVPGLTLDMQRLKELANFLKPYTCVRRVELLPFHKTAAFKWSVLGLVDPLVATPEPTPQQMEEARKWFE